MEIKRYVSRVITLICKESFETISNLKKKKNKKCQQKDQHNNS
jgi:hypothetical protein